MYREESLVTQNGVSVFSYKNPGLHGFYISLYLRAGSMLEDNPGITHFLEHVAIRNVDAVMGGRLYNTLEWGSWANTDYYHAAMVMSCSENDDLMQPENWSITEPVKYNPNWPGVANGITTGNIEGTLVLHPNGNLYNVMRYNIIDAKPLYGLALAYKVNTQNHEAPLEYSHSIKMPFAHAKFMIKFDEVGGYYYTIASRIDCVERRNHRNLLSLMRSADMENWELVCDLIDKRRENMEKIGFQYCDFSFEGNDIIFLCRTAISGAINFHDTNYSTFHRIKNFRDL